MNKHAQLFLSMLALLLATLPAFGQTKKARPAADGEFRALIERYYAAWNTLTTEAPAVFYAKDADLVFYDILPLKYAGWEEYKAGVQKNFFDQMSSGKLTPQEDLRVERRGRVAWTTLTFHLSAKMKNGSAMELDARHTAIWEKRGGKWLVVHEHVSAPFPG